MSKHNLHCPICYRFVANDGALITEYRPRCYCYHCDRWVLAKVVEPKPVPPLDFSPEVFTARSSGNRIRTLPVHIPTTIKLETTKGMPELLFWFIITLILTTAGYVAYTVWGGKP